MQNNRFDFQFITLTYVIYIFVLSGMINYYKAYNVNYGAEKLVLPIS